MISFMRSWCEGIIIAVIISIIIEIIVPEVNYKKYVKVIIGIYILFVIMNPILENLNFKMDFSNILELDKNTISQDSSKKVVQEVFSNAMKENMKKSCILEGYENVYNIEFYFDNDFEELQKLEIILSNKKDIRVNRIQVGKNNNEISDEKYNDLKMTISKEYDISEDKIFITEE